MQLGPTRAGVRANGAIRMPRLLVLLVVAAVLVIAGGWWFMHRTATAPMSATAPAQAPAGQVKDTAAAAPAADVDALSVAELYDKAHAAMAANRMASPAGDNALEYYLRILAKEPDNEGARDALRELFPFVTGAVQDQINQGDFAEANRIIGLLTKADPDNYSLTILRSNLDARKRDADRAQAAQAQAAAAAAAAASRPAAPPPGAETSSASASVPAAATTAAPPKPIEAPPPAQQVATATPAPKPAEKPAGESRDARPISAPAPEYPLAAVRNRQQGWVDVEFTVGADGRVSGAKVTGANPSHVFDHAAIEAVERARYEPKLVDGEPKATVLRRRIVFTLGQ